MVAVITTGRLRKQQRPLHPGRSAGNAAAGDRRKKRRAVINPALRADKECTHRFRQHHRSSARYRQVHHAKVFICSTRSDEQQMPTRRIIRRCQQAIPARMQREIHLRITRACVNITRCGLMHREGFFIVYPEAARMPKSQCWRCLSA